MTSIGKSTTQLFNHFHARIDTGSSSSSTIGSLSTSATVNGIQLTHHHAQCAITHWKHGCIYSIAHVQPKSPIAMTSKQPSTCIDTKPRVTPSYRTYLSEE